MTGIRPFCAILMGEMKALELMKTHVVKIKADATLAQAIDLMDLYYVSCLPVVDDCERICGLISDQDILAAVRTVFQDGNGTYANARIVGSRCVGDHMQTSVRTASEHDEVATLVSEFIVDNVERIPVLDDSQRVLGMLHRVDILQAIYEGQLDQE